MIELGEVITVMAGEKLAFGNLVTMGEDGKIYRALPPHRLGRTFPIPPEAEFNDDGTMSIPSWRYSQITA